MYCNAKIFNKFQSYTQYGDVYHGKHLKSLNSKIWKYKGTIYKLRIDNGNESARVLFSKSKGVRGLKGLSLYRGMLMGLCGVGVGVNFSGFCW